MGIQPLNHAKPGSRSFNRLRLGASASLILTHQTRPCLLDDISSTGARLRIDQPLPKGTIAQLRFHELRVMSLVIWCEKGECGLRFERPLPLKDMQGMLWITQNRDLYERMCRESHAREWSDGIGN